MITTRTRILSFLATVAMLVSMLACFVIPASAGMADMTDAEKVSTWQKVILSLDLANTTAMKASIPLTYNAWYSAAKNKGKNQVDGAWVAPTEDNPAATSADIEAAVLAEIAGNVGFAGDETKTLHWKEFSGDGDNKYPRYLYHEFYEIASYGADADGETHWSISDPADWDEMDAVANAANDVADSKYVDTTTGEYFKGVTFHLTKNISFSADTDVRLPLGFNLPKVKRIFAGTIDGHGYGFEDIHIALTTTNNATSYFQGGSMTSSIGLIGFLGACTIKDFGINSGKIETRTGSGTSSPSTFGAVDSAATTPPTFIRVWSGADIEGRSHNHLNGLVGATSTSSNAVSVNGFVFDGTMKKVGASSTVARNKAYAIYGGSAATTPGDNGTFHNIIASPTITIDGTNLTDSFLFAFSADTKFKEAMENGAIKNVYGIGVLNTYRTGTSGADAGETTFGESNYNLITPNSALETAWTINTNPTATDPVYFTLVGDNIRPVAAKEDGTAPDNAIVRVILTGGAEDKTIYVNKGSELTAAKLAEELGVKESAIAEVTVGGEAQSLPYTVSGDVTINVTISRSKELKAIAATYSALEYKYLTVDAAAALKEFRDFAETATDEAAATYIDGNKEDELKAALVTYSDYDNAEKDGKEIPAYTEKGTYEAYNTAKAWTIRTAADWDAMITTSNSVTSGTVSAPVTYFDGVTFHLTDNIDFGKKERSPMGHDAPFAYFGGTLDGHGYGFENVYVTNRNGVNAGDADLKTDGTTYNCITTGLFQRLGKCTIQNFGINSGVFFQNTGATTTGVSTFGRVDANSEPTFNNVWSGATLASMCQATVSALVTTHNSSQCTKLTVNGFVFDGEMVKRSDTQQYVAGIAGGGWNTAYGSADSGSVNNVISAGDVYNGSFDHGDETATRIEEQTLVSALFNFKDEPSCATMKNVYGVGYNHGYLIGGTPNTIVTALKDTDTENDATYIGANSASLLPSDVTALDLAYNINRAPTNGEGETAVYFTLNDEGKIRPTDDTTNRIVKYTVTVNKPDAAGTPEEIYENAGTIDLNEVFDIYTGTGAEITVTQGAENTPVEKDENGKYTITDDATIVVNYTYDALCGMEQAKLDAELAKYEALDDQYLKDGEDVESGKIGLPTFREQAATAKAMEAGAEKLAALQAAVAAGANLQVEVTEDYTKVPAYSLHKTYEEYNLGKNWLIKEPADWTAMRDVADKATDDYFADVTFHLTDNVDFNNVQMAPMGINTTDGIGFAGILDGHGYGFSNVLIKNGTAYDEDATIVTGLFLRLDDCIIQNFGINSGLIQQTSSSNTGNVSTFGAVPSDAAPTLSRVWSSGWLVSSCNAQISALVGVLGNENDGGAKFNGVVLDGVYAKRNATDSYVAVSMMGKYGCAAADGNVFHNIILSGDVDIYSAIDFTELTYTQASTWTKNVNKVPTTYDLSAGQRAMFRFTDQAAYEAADIQNVYGITGEGTGVTDHKKVLAGYITGTGVPGTVGTNSADLLTTLSDVEVAHKINKEPTATDPVYFTFNDEGKIRPTGTEADKIVQVTLKVNDDAEVVKYYNNGTTLSLKNDLGVALVAGAEVMVNDVEHTVDAITLNGNTEIVVTYNSRADAVAALLKFDGIESIHLSNGEKLDEYRALVENENATEDQLKAIITWAETYDPQVTDVVANMPTYDKFDIYKDFNNNWLLDQAGWLAMVDASDDDETVTFENQNFHLKEDINFGGVAMKPLCYGSEFKGSIYGHGYGFTDVLIDETTIDTTKSYLGLIYKMSKGTLEHFGINSGAIDASEITESISVGALVGAAGEGLTVTKCWNGADVTGVKSGDKVMVSALFGTASKETDFSISVNGFLNYGTVTSVNTYSSELYATVIVAGTHFNKTGTIYNSLNTGTVTGVSLGTGEMPNPGRGNCFIRLNSTQNPPVRFQNNASVGDLPLFYYSDTSAVYDYTNGYTSAAAAAYALNGRTATIKDADDNAVTPVYYTLKDGKVTFGADNGSDQIIRVTVKGMGEEDVYVYFNANELITKDALATALNRWASDLTSIVVDGSEDNVADAGFTPTGDTTVTVVFAVCDHDGTIGEPKWISGTQTHQSTCTRCNEKFDAVKCSSVSEKEAGDVDLTTGKSIHTLDCTACGHHYEAACNGTKQSIDCTKNDKWIFTCKIHNAEYEIPDSATATEHAFGDNWTVAGGGELEHNQCTNDACEVKQSRYNGNFDANNINLTANANGEVVVSLKASYSSAKLFFELSEGYAYTVEGATKAEDGDYYIIREVDAPTITVKIDSEVGALGGTLRVDVKEAVSKDANAPEITDAFAEVEIGFTATPGDANGDTKVNLADALSTLYVYVGKEGASPINVANANVHLADGEAFENYDITLNDVHAIVRTWLKNTIAGL